VLLEHEDDELAHGVLDRVGGEDTDAVAGLVGVEDGVREELEGALVVLGLEPEVALDVYDDPARREAGLAAEGADVVGHEVELLARICRGEAV
jgi:hypothetical protein